MELSRSFLGETTIKGTGDSGSSLRNTGSEPTALSPAISNFRLPWRPDFSLFHFNTAPIRVVDIDGAPWFVATDIYGALGLTRWGGILNPLGADEKTLRGRTSLGLKPGRDVRLISESGLYKLIMRSDKATAKPFQDWVTRIVLPAIRKDGAYVMGEEKVSSGEMSEDEFLLRAHEILLRKVERLKQENAAMSKELNLVTVDEFRALNHAYWPHPMRVRLGVEASRMARLEGLQLSKQQREVTIRGQRHVTSVNVYDRQLLARAAADIGLAPAR